MSHTQHISSKVSFSFTPLINSDPDTHNVPVTSCIVAPNYCFIFDLDSDRTQVFSDHLISLHVSELCLGWLLPVQGQVLVQTSDQESWGHRYSSVVIMWETNDIRTLS